MPSGPVGPAVTGIDGVVASSKATSEASSEAPPKVGLAGKPPGGTGGWSNVIRSKVPSALARQTLLVPGVGSSTLVPGPLKMPVSASSLKPWKRVALRPATGSSGGFRLLTVQPVGVRWE